MWGHQSLPTHSWILYSSEDHPSWIQHLCVPARIIQHPCIPAISQCEDKFSSSAASCFPVGIQHPDDTRSSLGIPEGTSPPLAVVQEFVISLPPVPLYPVPCCPPTPHSTSDIASTGHALEKTWQGDREGK